MRRGPAQALIGTELAFEVNGQRLDLPSDAVLVSGGGGRSLQIFYVIGELDEPENLVMDARAERVWRMMTRRAADRILEGRMAVGRPARDLGRATKVWRYGEIGGCLDYWVHDFETPGPIVEERPDGYRLRRAGAGYRLSGRGIVG